jgi:regulator of sigma E protease
MTEILIKALAFIFAISLLVAVHEYGHYWVARKLGFKVLRFSIGFGNPLLRWRSKDADQVEYWISSLPLGGYVKMLDEREGEVPEEEAHRAFNRRPVWQRIAVLFAGPGANFLFAIAAFWFLYLTGAPGPQPYIHEVEEGSIAAEAGLRSEDVITAIGGDEIATLEQVPIGVFNELLGDGFIEMDVVGGDGAARAVTLDVRGKVSELTEPEALFDGLGIVFGPHQQVFITDVTSGEPASRSGLLAGDRVVSVDGQATPYVSSVADYLGARPGETVVVGVEREGQLREFRVAVGSFDEDGETVGRIGVSLQGDLIEGQRRYGPIRSVGIAVNETWAMTDLTIKMLVRMVTGDVSLKNVSGPLMIADYAGDYIRAGFDDFLKFLCLISISLGIMNLLPVPILDGGQIVMCLVEGLKGSPISMRTALIGQQIGLAMLIALMGFVFYNDITRMLGL